MRLVNRCFEGIKRDDRITLQSFNSDGQCLLAADQCVICRYGILIMRVLAFVVKTCENTWLNAEFNVNGA